MTTRLITLLIALRSLEAVCAAAPCAPASLTIYTSPGFSCTHGGTTAWSQFSLTSSGFYSFGALTPADIFVTPGGSQQYPSFTFAGPFTSGVGDQGTYVIRYRGVTSQGLVFKGIGAFLNGAIATSPTVRLSLITQTRNAGGQLLYPSPFVYHVFNGSQLEGVNLSEFQSVDQIEVVDSLTLAAPREGIASATGVRNLFKVVAASVP